MGTYFKLVNTSRREVFEPEGLKRSSFLREAEAFMKLMLGDWYKHNVCMISDAEDERTPAGTIYEDSEHWPNRAPQRWRMEEERERQLEELRDRSSDPTLDDWWGSDDDDEP